MAISSSARQLGPSIGRSLGVTREASLPLRASAATRRLLEALKLPSSSSSSNHSNNHSKDARRHMSIMDRYRKLRPAPEPQDKPWTAPKDEPAGPSEEAPHSSSSSSAPADLSSWQPKRGLAYTRAPLPQEVRFCTFQPPIQPANPRMLRVGLAGPPNAGKSSLLNAILEAPISAISPKVNTTRDGLRGIKTHGNVQLVFLDAPGIIPSHDRKFNRDLVTKAWRGFNECDVCLLVIDVVKRPTQEVFDVVRRMCPKDDLRDSELRRRLKAADEVGMDMPSVWLPPGATPLGDGLDSGPLEEAAPHRPPVILVLNKIDMAEEFRWVLSRQKEFTAQGYFDGIFYVSAKKDQGLEKLVSHLQERAPPRPWVYPADLRTDLPHTEQIKQMVSTYLFKWFNSDVPYKLEQQTVGWTPRLDGSLLIEHEIITEDSVVARMVLGVRNTIVTRLSDQVSYKLKKLWGMDVDLKIWVRPLKQRWSLKDRGLAPNEADRKKKSQAAYRKRQHLGKAANKK